MMTRSGTASTPSFDYGVLICGPTFSGKSTLLRWIQKQKLLALMGLADENNNNHTTVMMNQSSSVVEVMIRDEILNRCFRAMKDVLNEIKFIEEHSSHRSTWSNYSELMNNYSKQMEIMRTVTFRLSHQNRSDILKIIRAMEDLWAVPIVKITYEQMMKDAYFSPLSATKNNTEPTKTENFGENFHLLFENLHALLSTNNFSKSDITMNYLLSHNKIMEMLFQAYFPNSFFTSFSMTGVADDKEKKDTPYINEDKPMIAQYGQRKWCVKVVSSQISYISLVSPLEFNERRDLAPIVLFLVPLADVDTYKKNVLLLKVYIKNFISVLSTPGIQVVLIFTKVDIFAKKVMTGSMKILELFPDFSGNERDPLRVFELIFNQFWIQCRRYHENVPYYAVNLIDQEESSQFLSILLERGSPYGTRSFISRHLLSMMEVSMKNNLKNSVSKWHESKTYFSDVIVHF
ncbi:hypothetical protein C9374_009272 [Naegleria lovaniensis]|uniref:Uncharacterized protein n=1 Tax=Naegleria lovaniensis TaxID=51637 RepID=A0AA88GIY6_NAELO|nr:uncharacterized protein C9374_009272 [Naegleria lovaniensis]KAG2377361.1 hypothetical protein C9374_009272 [Naegleria lovaniensis]